MTNDVKYRNRSSSSERRMIDFVQLVSGMKRSDTPMIIE